MSSKPGSLLRSIVLFAGLAFHSHQASAMVVVDQAQELARSMADAMDAQRWPEVIAFGERVLAIDPKHPLALHDVGYAYHQQGKLDQALEYHKRCAELPKYRAVGCYNAACAFALKGEKESALDWLEKSADAGFAQFDLIETDSDLKSLADEPRFAKFVAKVKSNAEGGTATVPRMFASQKMQRAGSRVACFTNTGSPGEVAIEYGPIQWKDEYDDQLASGKFDGKRWRLGADFFTNVDANIGFTLAGTHFEPGEYYLLLERNLTDGKARFDLVLVPASEVRKAHVDAFWAHQVTGGVTVSMTHSTTTKAEPTLLLELATENEQSPDGSFSVRFGPHVLTCPFTIEVDGAK